MNIKRSFRRCMADKDINQKELAVKIGVHESTLSVWISTGQMTTKNLSKSAKVFGITASEFIALGE